MLTNQAILRIITQPREKVNKRCSSFLVVYDISFGWIAFAREKVELVCGRRRLERTLLQTRKAGKLLAQFERFFWFWQSVVSFSVQNNTSELVGNFRGSELFTTEYEGFR